MFDDQQILYREEVKQQCFMNRNYMKNMLLGIFLSPDGPIVYDYIPEPYFDKVVLMVYGTTKQQVILLQLPTDEFLKIVYFSDNEYSKKALKSLLTNIILGILYFA